MSRQVRPFAITLLLLAGCGAEPPPRVARVAAAHSVSVAADNQYYVTARVNGAAVRFVVDTGASIVVLRPADARRAGVRAEAADYTLEAASPSGAIALAPVTLARVEVGTRRVDRVEAAVGDDAMDVSLLGMSWLARAGRIVIDDGRLTIGE